MHNPMKLALDIIERIDAAETPMAAGQAFLHGLNAFDPKSLIVQDLRVTSHITPDGRRGAAPLCHIVPPGWEGSSESRFMDRHNPNPAAGLKLRRTFLWREAKLATASLDGEYWEALGAHGGAEGLCIPLFGPSFYMAGVSLCFGNPEIEPREQRAIEIAGFALIERCRGLALDSRRERPGLSVREHDCLGYVAAGKSDWEISVILGLAQATVHTHVEKAKTKLGASTRAQAVAIALSRELI